MLSRACRFLTTATLSISIASAVVVALFSVLMLASFLKQPCVAIYRQDHPHYDFILDLIGFPLMSGFFAVMSWKMSESCRQLMVDGPFNWISAGAGTLMVFFLSMIAGSNLTIAVWVCSRHAAVWSYCRTI